MQPWLPTGVGPKPSYSSKAEVLVVFLPGHSRRHYVALLADTLLEIFSRCKTETVFWY